MLRKISLQLFLSILNIYHSKALSFLRNVCQSWLRGEGANNLGILLLSLSLQYFFFNSFCWKELSLSAIDFPAPSSGFQCCWQQKNWMICWLYPQMQQSSLHVEVSQYLATWSWYFLLPARDLEGRIDQYLKRAVRIRGRRARQEQLGQSAAEFSQFKLHPCSYLLDMVQHCRFPRTTPWCQPGYWGSNNPSLSVPQELTFISHLSSQTINVIMLNSGQLHLALLSFTSVSMSESCRRAFVHDISPASPQGSPWAWKMVLLLYTHLAFCTFLEVCSCKNSITTICYNGFRISDWAVKPRTSQSLKMPQHFPLKQDC